MPIAFQSRGPVDAPEAPVLLLLHSLGWDHTMWDPQIDAWSREFRVVSVDLRGHGQSSTAKSSTEESHRHRRPTTLADLAGDALEVLDSLGVDTFSVCGLSLGGQVALWLAAHHPTRVRRLVACATGARIGDAAGWNARIEKVRADGLQSIAGLVLERFFSPSFLAAGGLGIGSARVALFGVSDEGYIACCEALRDADLRADLGNIRAPTLLLAGGADVSTPPAVLAELQRGIAGASLVEFNEAGHILTREFPEETTTLIAAHVRG